MQNLSKPSQLSFVLITDYLLVISFFAHFFIIIFYYSFSARCVSLPVTALLFVKNSLVVLETARYLCTVYTHLYTVHCVALELDTALALRVIPTLYVFQKIL
jgi:hypothetical protein